jgi:hypothetical protein
MASSYASLAYASTSGRVWQGEVGVQLLVFTSASPCSASFSRAFSCTLSTRLASATSAFCCCWLSSASTTSPPPAVSSAPSCSAWRRGAVGINDSNELKLDALGSPCTNPNHTQPHPTTQRHKAIEPGINISA